MTSWDETSRALSAIAERQLFFIGGAPRSGTTWLQQIFDSHPDACCKGEGLFAKDLYPPLEAAMVARRRALETKNQGLFRHTGGYPLPTPEDTEFLAGTAMLLAFSQQAGAKNCRAYGEKTPENVFFFARFRALFPRARFIAIARDPRDVLTSAWYFFRKPPAGADDRAGKMDFIRSALPSLAEGARAMLAFGERHPDAYRMVTYENLRRDPEPAVGALFPLSGAVRQCGDGARLPRRDILRPGHRRPRGGRGPERRVLAEGRRRGLAKHPDAGDERSHPARSGLDVSPFRLGALK